MATPKKAKKASAPRVSAKSVRLALKEYGGNVTAVAEAFERSRQTVYNWIIKYQLRDLLEDERDTLYSTSVKNVAMYVNAGDPEMSRFVLTHKPGELRWSAKTEVRSEIDLPPGVLATLQAAGVDIKQTLVELAKIAQERDGTDKHG